MSFLSPWYLIGILAVGVPLWLHLMWSRPRSRVLFSATRFLEQTQLPKREKRRLEHPLLFALRCLIILGLVVAFARPFVDKGIPPPLGPGNVQRQVVVLVDRSASMRDGVWTAALRMAHREFDNLGAGDNVALAVFDRSVDRLLGFSERAVSTEAEIDARGQLLKQALSAVSPSWEITRTGRALSEAVEWLGEIEDSTFSALKALPDEPISLTREVILISDLQEGSDLSEWWSGTLAENRIGLTLIAVGETAVQNTSIHRVAEHRRAGDEKGELWLRVTRDASTEAAGTVLLRDLQGEERARFDWQNEESRIVKVPVDSELRQLELSDGGSLVFDDVTYFSAASKDQLKVIYLGDEAPDDVERAGFYLGKSMVETSDYAIDFLHLPTGDPKMADEFVEADWVIVGSPLSLAASRSLSRRVERGLPVLVVLRDSEMAATASALLGTEISLRAVIADRGERYSEIDFTVPFFAPFAASEYQSFSDLRVTRYQRLGGDYFRDHDPRIIARYGSGEPAWLAQSVGEGEVTLMTTSWDRRDSNWVLSSRFVAMLHGQLGRVRSMRAFDSGYRVGDVLSAERLDGRTVLGPDGAARVTGEGENLRLDEPGIYRVRDGREQIYEMAVNIDPRESRVSRMSEARLAASGLLEQRYPESLEVLDSRDAAMRSPIRDFRTETEMTQNLWKLLLWVVVGLFAIEVVWSRLVKMRPSE